MNTPQTQTVSPNMARLNSCAGPNTPYSNHMYRYLMVAALSIASANLFAQDAATLAAQREAEERDARTRNAISRLEETTQRYQSKINELNNEIANVRRQLVEFENRYKNAQLGAVTQSDIRKLYDTIEKVEKNRQADNEL